jgi:hypothetical protein
MKKSFILLILSITVLSTKAQESVNASGRDAIGSGGTIAYSVGQIIYSSNSGGTGTISQGVQHAYEIYAIGINETALDISVIVLPNPTTENLTLQISEYKNEKLFYQLYDLQGKQISNGQISTQQTQINMSSLQTANYFLNIVNQENITIQIFKIIKN